MGDLQVNTAVFVTKTPISARQLFSKQYSFLLAGCFDPLLPQNLWVPEGGQARKIVPNQKKKKPKLLCLQKYRYFRPNPLLRDDEEKEEWGLSPVLYPA